MINVIIIKHARFSYSLIESKLVSWALTCGYKFHALAVHLHPTLIATFQSEAHLESSWTSTVELFCRNSRCGSFFAVIIFGPFAIFAEELHGGCWTNLGLTEVLDWPRVLISLPQNCASILKWHIYQPQ